MVNERLSRMETEVEHIKDDITEVKNKVETIGDSICRIDLAITKLAMIAEQNQQIEPRVKAVELKIARWCGMLAVGAVFLSMYGDEVKVVMSSITGS